MVSIRILPVSQQAKGAFNGGEIVENKPIVFRSLSSVKPYSNLFYWAHAKALVDSTIGLHPHQGFEICSFILRGPVRHFDTKLQNWRLLDTGDVQIIRSGSGISHSEFMGKGSEMFQIWFDPNIQKALQKPASYDDYRLENFPIDAPHAGVRRKIIMGPGSPMMMDTPGIEVFHLALENTTFTLDLQPGRVYSAYVIAGVVHFNEQPAQTSEFAVLSNEGEVNIRPESQAEVFVIVSPAEPGYGTYAG